MPRFPLSHKRERSRGPWLRQVVLSCRSSLRTAPSDALPAQHDFPFGGYTRRLLPDRNARGRGGPLQFPAPPSERSTPFTAGGSPALPFQVPRASHGPRPDTPGSAPLVPFGLVLRRGRLRLDAADRSVASSKEALDAGLRRRAFPPDAASLLPGSLVITRTGLTPAGGHALVDVDHLKQPHLLSSVAGAHVCWAHET